MSERPTEIASKRVDRFSRRYRENTRNELKETLPVLTYRDIRRYREPYHQVVCKELQEDTYEQSAVYTERLLRLEQDIRQLAGPGTAEWVRPQLRHQIHFLEKLRLGLTEAELAREQGQAGFDCGAYLQLGLFFMQKPPVWWWLAEQLLLQAVAAGQRCKTDGGRREAIARYVYGGFLLEQMGDATQAHRQLETARKLSAGRDWISELDMGVQLDDVFTAASLRLHAAAVTLITQTRPTDPKRAVRLSKVAVRRVRGRGWHRQEAEALLQLGVSLELAGEPREALSALQRYAALVPELAPPTTSPARAAAQPQPAVPVPEDAAGRCSASLVAAICHLRLGRPKLTEAWLEKFLEDAKRYELSEMVAAGHRYLGEFYLSQDCPAEAAPHLVESFTLYFEAAASPSANQAEKLSAVAAAEQTRALAGIATGQEHLPHLQDLLLECTGHRPPAFTRLLRWKDIREPFWPPIRTPAGSKYRDITEFEEEEDEEEEEEEQEADEGVEEEDDEEREEDQPEPVQVIEIHKFGSKATAEEASDEALSP